MYRVELSSDKNYENLIAEIYVGDVFIAAVLYEDSKSEFMLEFSKISRGASESEKSCLIGVDEFGRAIEEAKRRLIENGAGPSLGR